MTYSSIVISSGHSTKCQGANGILNEVREATRVVDRVYDNLKEAGIKVEKFHDTVSTTQDQNLNRIVDFHNSRLPHDLDVSVHFNAFEPTNKAMGTEVLYVSQNALAKEVSAAIASVGFIDRGPKKRTDLFFLNNTAMPAILIEVCFVDSSTDAGIYNRTFDEICNVIGGVLVGDKISPVKGDFEVTGKCSYFGGPDDTAVAADEGLALCSSVDDAPQLFLPYQPEGTSGLARRLNPHIHYVACRWDYDKTSKSTLLEDVALVRSTKTGLALTAFPADWGPNEKTGRVADLSPGLLADLDLTTDDEVEVVFPYRE